MEIYVLLKHNQLVNDFHALVELGCRKKTQFECIYPFLHIYPEIKEQYVLSGLSIDGYYGLSKKGIHDTL